MHQGKTCFVWVAGFGVTRGGGAVHQGKCGCGMKDALVTMSGSHGRLGPAPLMCGGPMQSKWLPTSATHAGPCAQAKRDTRNPTVLSPERNLGPYRTTVRAAHTAPPAGGSKGACGSSPAGGNVAALLATPNHLQLCALLLAAPADCTCQSPQCRRRATASSAPSSLEELCCGRCDSFVAANGRRSTDGDRWKQRGQLIVLCIDFF